MKKYILASIKMTIGDARDLCCGIYFGIVALIGKMTTWQWRWRKVNS